jgi:hypothetical protein
MASMAAPHGGLDQRQSRQGADGGHDEHEPRRDRQQLEALARTSKGRQPDDGGREEQREKRARDAAAHERAGRQAQQRQRERCPQPPLGEAVATEPPRFGEEGRDGEPKDRDDGEPLLRGGPGQREAGAIARSPYQDDPRTERQEALRHRQALARA